MKARAPGRDGTIGALTLSEVPHRAHMERAFGQDFSSVTATVAPGKLTQLGAMGAAMGDRVVFAEASPSPRLVAHELAHVVQHRRAGGAPAGVGRADHASEREASEVADRVARGEPAGAIGEAPAGAVQRFAPEGHEAATVEGLAGSFSAEELGEIYASNWERDFSQGNAAVASAVLAWKAVKNHAATHRGDPGAAAAPFRAAVLDVVNARIWTADDESLDGYHYWDHSDRPGEGEQEDADQRWAGATHGLAGYLADARAYIKDQMVAALDVYRELHHLESVGAIDNWAGGERPEGYVSPSVGRDGDYVTSTFPAGYDDPAVASREPVRTQAAAHARSAGAARDPDHNAEQWRIVGQHLGRAMHAFEDFWAHSNWLELAKDALARARDGETVEAGAADNAELKTGTFTMPAKAHAAATSWSRSRRRSAATSH